MIELMGGYVDENPDTFRKIWHDGFKDRRTGSCRRVSKKEFLLLMKGQRQEEATETETNELPSLLDTNAGRAISLPEHTCIDGEIARAVSAPGETPLAANRMLYRAHRQTRIAVLEASRRFEEEQMKRTAKKLHESLLNEAQSDVSSRLYGASLVMRHSKDATATAESVRKMVQEAQEAMHARIDKAAKKSGRAYDRKKSYSDMAATLGSVPPPSPPSLNRKRIPSMEGSAPEILQHLDGK